MPTSNHETRSRQMPSLFDSIQTGAFKMANRIGMALTRMRAFVDLSQGSLNATHYALRASAGADHYEGDVGYPQGVGVSQYARDFANPDLVERFRRSAPLNTVDTATVYTDDETAYNDYPLLDEAVCDQASLAR